MAVRALGAGQLVDSEGTWPTNYVNFANENDILKNVGAIYTATATRMNAATIVANTLEAVMWEKTGVKSNGEITWGKTYPAETILKDVLNYTHVKGIKVEHFNYKDNELDVDTDSNTTPASFAEDTYEVKDTFDMATLKEGIVYDAYYDKDEDLILGLWKAEDSKTNVVEFTEVAKYGTDYVRFLINDKEKEYDVVTGDSATVFKFNNDTLDDYDEFIGVITAYGKENIFGSVEVKSGDMVTVYAEGYTNVGVVDETSATRIKFDSMDGKAEKYVSASTLKIDDEDLVYNVVKNGKAIDVKDIDEDDVVFYYTEKNEGKVFHILVVTDSKDGEVSSVGSNYIKLDGTKYMMVALDDTPAAEAEVELFFNAAGKVVAWREIEGAAGDYAVIKSIEAVQGRKGIDVEVLLGFFDGTTSDKLKVDFSDDDNDYTIDEIITLGKGADTNTLAATVKNYNCAVEGKKANDDDTAIGSSLLGTIVKYEIDGSDVIFTDFDADDDHNSDTDITYTKGTRSYFADGSSRLYVNNNTKVLVMKDDDKNYKVKTSLVDIDSLENTKLDASKSAGEKGLAIEFVDVDDDNVVKYIVIDERVNKVQRGKVSSDWAIVTDKSTKNAGDFKYEVTLIDQNGKELEYYTDLEVTVGMIGVMTVEDDELTELDDDDLENIIYSADEALFLVEEKNGVIYYVDNDDITEKLSQVLSDEVLYLEITNDGVEVGRENDIDALDGYNDIEEYEATKADETNAVKFFDGTDWDTTVSEGSSYYELNGKLYLNFADAFAETAEDATVLNALYTIEDDGNLEVIAIIYYASDFNFLP